jgi:hypothetical protein
MKPKTRLVKDLVKDLTNSDGRAEGRYRQRGKPVKITFTFFHYIVIIYT